MFQRAKSEGWARDLSAKVSQRAGELVSKALVSKEVSREAEVSERQLVETNEVIRNVQRPRDFQ